VTSPQTLILDHHVGSTTAPTQPPQDEITRNLKYEHASTAGP
jgi:hypothetical protein